MLAEAECEFQVNSCYMHSSWIYWQIWDEPERRLDFLLTNEMREEWYLKAEEAKNFWNNRQWSHYFRSIKLAIHEEVEATCPWHCFLTQIMSLNSLVWPSLVWSITLPPKYYFNNSGFFPPVDILFLSQINC